MSTYIEQAAGRRGQPKRGQGDASRLRGAHAPHAQRARRPPAGTVPCMPQLRFTGLFPRCSRRTRVVLGRARAGEALLDLGSVCQRRMTEDLARSWRRPAAAAAAARATHRWAGGVAGVGLDGVLPGLVFSEVPAGLDEREERGPHTEDVRPPGLRARQRAWAWVTCGAHSGRRASGTIPAWHARDARCVHGTQAPTGGRPPARPTTRWVHAAALRAAH